MTGEDGAMRSLFLACHHDDETLFGAYTLLRHNPDVVVCLLSEVQEAFGITQETRATETTAALAVLGISDWRQWAYSDKDPDWREIERRIEMCAYNFDFVYAPLPELGGHEHHNHVGGIAADVFGDSVQFYATYRRGERRTRTETEVPFEPHWPALKLRAMACYESQITLENTRPWFDDWQREWLG